METATTDVIPNRRVLVKRGQRKVKPKKAMSEGYKYPEYSSTSSDSSVEVDNSCSSSTSEEDEERSGSISEETQSDEDADEQEEKKYYRPGGYHPVRLGEVYNNGRYRVVRKLGWGVFSTVWLCRDVPSGKFAALKILRSNPRYREVADDEIKLLMRVQTADPKDDRKLKTVQLLTSFIIPGPHGLHICMAFEICGPNLYSIISQSNFQGLPIRTVKSIMKQILDAMDYLHTKCKIIHTDLKPENILTCLKTSAIKKLATDAEDLVKSGGKLPSSIVIHAPSKYPTFLTEEELKSKKVSKNMKKKLKKKAKKQEQMMGTANVEENDGTEQSETAEEDSYSLDFDVKIGDLGNACFVDDQLTDHIQTRQYRSPEVILGHKYDTTTDVWSMACIAFELVTGNFLFDPRKPKRYSRDEEHLACMMRVLGDIPKKMRLGGSNSGKFFNIKTGCLKYAEEFEPRNLFSTLTQKHQVPDQDAEKFGDFLLPMLEYEPKYRASAADCLKHEWILSFANAESQLPVIETDAQVDEVKKICIPTPGQSGDADIDTTQNYSKS